MTRRTPATALSALIGAVVATVLLTACSTPDGGGPAAAPAEELLGSYGLADLDARAVIDRLEATPLSDRPEGLLASVRPDALVLSDDANGEVSLPMDDDAFYVSLAPYVDQTHECFFHSLTTCRGELRNEDVQVRVTSRADGSVVVDETVATNDNGFVGLWLPRDLDAIVTVRSGDRTMSAPLSTADDAPTCVTTLRLA